MNKDPGRWARIKAAFEQASDLPAADRMAYLASAEPGMANLSVDERDELRSLLAHHDAAEARTAAHEHTPVLQAGAAALLAGSAPPLPTATPGQRLGSWEVLRLIGSGGMGEVFEARRADGQFDGRAAIKLLRRGMDSAGVLARFALERQALARLQHPHIARLLDAGATEHGQPYFVMEFVDGRPIHDVAATLDLPARLRLFLQLTDAVAHAHRQLLVHRDLKPGNVLVDPAGQVKLLDFGVAKALDPLEGRIGFDPQTVSGERPYTPHYASPEQVRGEPVGTATDVYSLGVLLYQLLTGTRPTGREATTPAEAARGVLEETPTRPSRLDQLGDSASTSASPSDWPRLRRRLQGDLDTITLKALAKDPAERYASVDALAADIRAHLEGRPILARPAPAWLVASKFIRRHAVASSAVALGGLGLVLGLAASLAQGRMGVAVGVGAAAVGLALAVLQARRAWRAQRATEHQVAELRRMAREVVVAFGDLVTFLPEGRQRKAQLFEATAASLQRLQDQGAADAPLQAELAVLHAQLAHLHADGEFNPSVDGERVLRHGEMAVRQAEAAEAAGAAHRQLYEWWALALSDMGRVAHKQADLALAAKRYDEADLVLARALRRLPGDTQLQRTGRAVANLRIDLLAGWDKPDHGQLEAALSAIDRAIALHLQAATEPLRTGQPAMAADWFEVGTAHGRRALLMARQRRFAEALPAAVESLQWREKALALEPHNRMIQGGVAADRNLVAGLNLDLDRPHDALKVSSAGWAAITQLTAEDPGNQTWVLQRLWLSFHHGRALLRTNRPAQAMEVLQVSVDWLAPLVASGESAPRQRTRWARSVLALVQAQRAVAMGDGHEQLGAVAQLLEQHLRQAPGDEDARSAWAECLALQASAGR
jgi:eukaryotic-like serine/threonine-protein kinase